MNTSEARSMPVRSGLVVWGTVTAVSPAKVRIAGDTRDVTIPYRLSDYTLTTGDRVVLLRVGSNSWMALGKLVAA